MTAVSSGSETLVFHTASEVKNHILRKIQSNKQKLIGTEVEMFLLNEDGNPITRSNGQKVFIGLSQQFEKNYKPTFVSEKMADGVRKIVSLTVPGLGSINLEAGHQFEFAAEPSKTIDQVKDKNTIALDIFDRVAKSLNHHPVYTGFLPNYADRTEGVPRSRGRSWDWFYTDFYGPSDVRLLRKGQHGTASTQFTIDSGSDKFHEYWKALLILEPVLVFLNNYRTERLPIIHNVYGSLIPTQVKPIADAWNATSAEETVSMIVDRLMQLEVPFLPDPANPGTYAPEQVSFSGRPPTVKELMENGRLSEATLNNIGGFFYTGPALRNFTHGLIEVRYIDSIRSPTQISEIADFIMHFVYDDKARKQLLDYASFMTVERVEYLHRAAAMENRRSALAIVLAGRTISSIVSDIGKMYSDRRNFSASANLTTAASNESGCPIAGVCLTGDTIQAAQRARHRLPFVHDVFDGPHIPGARRYRFPDSGRLVV